MHMHSDRSPVDLPCACTTVRKAARAISRVYDDALAGAGMNVGQLAILRAIGRADPAGVALGSLAATLVMDNTSLYRALAPLERAGWVEITPSGTGRAKRVRHTDAGRAATAAAAAAWQAVQSRIVTAFGVARWADVQAAIADLTAIGVQLGAGGHRHDT